MSAPQFSSGMLKNFKELAFCRKVLLAQRQVSENFSWKDKLCSFYELPAWWKSTQTSLLTKDERLLKHWNFKNLKRQILLILWASRMVKIYSNTSFDKKWEILKALKLQTLEKANCTYFVSFPVGENLLKHFFWQKWGSFNALKLQKLENANFTHFFRRPIGENYSNSIFDKSKRFSKLWSLKSLKRKDFLIL